MRAKHLYAGLLVSLIPAIIGGCPKPQGANPVTSVDVTLQTPDPTAQNAGVTFVVTFDQDVTGFSDPATSVQLEYSGTTGGQVTITAIDQKTYHVTVTAVTGQGTFTLVVPQGAAQDSLGNPSPAGSSAPVAVDTVAPVVTVNALSTNDTTPALTGSVDDPKAIVAVTVAGKTYAATNNGDGTWTLADNVITPVLANGTYDVAVTATDAAGNVGHDTTTNELTIATAAPTVTVNTLTTSDTTPALSGTVGNPNATVTVTVAGKTYNATNNGNGTWTLADNVIAPALANGTYDVTVTATDAAGSVGHDATTNELTIATAAPTVAVNTLTTKDTTPALSGTVGDPNATVTVTVAGNTYHATNNGNGTWTLADNTISPALADGQYDVSASAKDALGNVSNVTASKALTIDTTAPNVGVNPLVTNNVRPVLHGTVSDPSATVQVAIGGGAAVPAANNGDGTWTLTTTADIADGQYDVSATASDAAGNSTTVTQVGALTVDTVAPVVAVNPLVTGDSSPALSGTVTDATATTVKVTVNGVTYDAVVAGGTWTLAGGTIAPALAAGTYDITVAATDAAGNTGSSTAMGALTVTTAPTITGASLATDNSYMDITFSQPVYGDAAHSLPVGVSGFVRTYTPSDDPVTDVTIASVQTPGGSPLVGGETQVRVGLTLTGGPTEGLSYVRITTAVNAIYNFQGQAALDTSGDRRLHDPANLLSASAYDWSFDGFAGVAGPSWNPVNASGDSTVVHSGSRSVKFTAPTNTFADRSITVPNDADGTDSVDVGTTAGTNFTLSAWVYVAPNTTGVPGDTGLRLQLEMELAGGGFTTVQSDFTVPAFNTWTKVTYADVLPNGVSLTGRAWAVFQTSWINLNDSDVYVDDLRLTLP